MRKPDRDAFAIRQALQGGLDATALPFELRGLFQKLQRQLYRRHERYQKREAKAQQYAAAGLNGKRAVERRQRQIAAGQLQASP
jgi:hypothetical protein